MRNRKAEKQSLPRSLDADEPENQKNVEGGPPRVSTIKPALTICVAAVFTIGSFLDRTDYVPPAVTRGFILIGLAYLGYRLLIFKRWSDESRYVIRFLLCVAAMVAELLVENFLVWYVSQTDKHKWEMAPGLQDNVEDLVVGLEGGKWGGWVKWAFRSHWAHIMHFLGCLLALAFGNIFDQVPYSGFGLMARVTLTICLSRIVRVGCFLSTVVPSPRPGCFMRRFNYVPANWPDFWRAGMNSMRGSGGCNDLIFSGHGAFWTMAPVAFKDYYGGRVSLLILWVALFQASVRDVLERQHYSVDMFLAVVVTWLVWEQLRWVYPPSKPLPARRPGFSRDAINPWVLGLICVALSVLAYGIIVSGA